MVFAVLLDGLRWSYRLSAAPSVVATDSRLERVILSASTTALHVAINEGQLAANTCCSYCQSGCFMRSANRALDFDRRRADRLASMLSDEVC
jgi:ATP-dependent helicase YprA (DUF1998 family)